MSDSDTYTNYTVPQLYNRDLKMTNSFLNTDDQNSMNVSQYIIY